MTPEMNARIDAMENDFVEILTKWLQVPSVKSEPAEGAPFGTEIRRMLDLAMETGRELGFTVNNCDNYACDMVLGDAPEQIAVLAHLDVVPAGDGWRVPPFAAVREGDKIIARGTSDDKGPGLAALFAMKAIKDAGIPLKRGIKLIFGTDEECGSSCIKYYIKHADMPEVGFSPDASFPLINTEKGMVGMTAVAPLSKEGLQILELWTGSRTNVIPGECTALVAGGEELIAKTAAYAEKTGLPYTAVQEEGGIRLTALGIAGHSAYPEGRRNAIGMMLLLLKELGAAGPVVTLADCIGIESDGKSIGVAYEDEISGHLTLNTGILHVEDGKLLITLDLRVPITADLDKIDSILKDHLQGFEFPRLSHTVPHHVPADSELVTKLIEAYNEETGENGKPQYTGGGTYAKLLKQGVAFGASFPWDEDLAHQANEYITIPGIMKTIKIYASALLKLCAE